MIDFLLKQHRAVKTCSIDKANAMSRAHSLARLSVYSGHKGSDFFSVGQMMKDVFLACSR